MPEYLFTREGAINQPVLDAAVRAINPVEITGFTVLDNTVKVLSNAELTPQELIDLEAAIDNHDPSPTEAQQDQLTGRAALAEFLESHADDMKYARYLYELFASVLELWTTKPNLTDRTTAVLKALRGGKDTAAEITDPDDLAMYRAYLDMAAIEYGLTVTADEIVFSATPATRIAQARSALACARSFMNTGTMMAHMILMRGLI